MFARDLFRLPEAEQEHQAEHRNLKGYRTCLQFEILLSSKQSSLEGRPKDS